MIERIISGGQTGIDQAGLFLATTFEIPIGGWCPKGGLDENGFCILEKYPCLQETTSSDPDERTRLNIRDSDGTLIIVPCWPLPERIQDGTRLTISEAISQGKPHLIVNLMDQEGAIVGICQWINQENISVLNVAGPRESSSPGIYVAALDLFNALFSTVLVESKPAPHL